MVGRTAAAADRQAHPAAPKVDSPAAVAMDLAAELVDPMEEFLEMEVAWLAPTQGRMADSKGMEAAVEVAMVG